MMFHQRFAPLEAPRFTRAVVLTLALCFIGAGARFSYGTVLTLLTAGNSTHDDKPVWRVFSPAALNEAHARGEHVIVDFTAAWCMNCQYNKKLVLDNDGIVALLREKHVTLLKADLTGENRPAESLLEHLGSRSIPFLAIFPGDDPYQPVVMRDVLRRANLRDALKALPER